MQAIRTAEVVQVTKAAEITDTAVRDLFRELGREEITFRNVIIRLQANKNPKDKIRVTQQFIRLETNGLIRPLIPGSEKYRAIRGI